MEKQATFDPMLTAQFIAATASTEAKLGILGALQLD
jgi:hypothetical protein